MQSREMLTDFRTVVLPDSENDMSRRYLQVLMRWVPVALQAFNSWPERPHCGHFFGGVYWYGLETAGPSATLALVASSPCAPGGGRAGPPRAPPVREEMRLIKARRRTPCSRQ